ncbi:TIGR02594 family protein [Ignatzschineria indica]|uniref:TIGR02594 family protein n=1 Tax=Ignatzschineria indica TaxID=472583 RepID=UPI0025749F9D|nr:TIGR02594 family protein [Ignatzschineria indica]MDM1545533.1 TIGR02594 family protein [Ignatzschineria indica]
MNAGVVGGAAKVVSENQLNFPWIEWGMKEIGVKRTGIGAGNPRIIEYWKMFRMSGIKNERISWCSAFVGAALEASGINTNSKDKSIYQRRTKDSSQYWLHWDGGEKVSPCYGCIAVMTRSGGGHVGFLVGEDGDNWVLLGGNQGSAVSIAKFPKSRFIGYVMPKGYKSLKPIPSLKADGEVNLR